MIFISASLLSDEMTVKRKQISELKKEYTYHGAASKLSFHCFYRRVDVIKLKYECACFFLPGYKHVCVCGYRYLLVAERDIDSPEQERRAFEKTSTEHQQGNPTQITTGLSNT